MSGPANDFACTHFSTDTLPERERVAMLRDFIGPVVARLDIEPTGAGRLHFEVTARATPDLAISTLAFSALRAERTSVLAADGNDNCLLSFLHSPGNSVLYRGNEVRPGEGAGTLLSMADPFACATVGGIARGMTVSVPRRVLADMVPDLEDCFARVMVRNSEVLRLLVGYVGLLDSNDLTTPELRSRVVAHVHDLAGLALGASRDVAEIAKGRGLRAARLHAIKANIRASLDEPGLTLTSVAARHGVSPRYVQVLFEDDRTTFSHFLVAERLSRAHRMLRDPQQLPRSISAIAYAAGFSDLSHFNRVFRRRYGETPSQVRAAATSEPGE